MATPKLALTDLTAAQANAHATVNTNTGILEAFSFLRVLDITNTPGTTTNGNTYIVGAAGTGAWSGQNNKIAHYLNGWTFYAPFNGMMAFVVADAGTTVNELRGYNEAAAAYSSSPGGWFPLQPRWSATEHWTGQYHGGTASTNRVWSKAFTITLPNATTTTTAHGITNLNLAAGALFTMEGTYTNATTMWNFNNLDASNLLCWNINATNILAISAQNLSAYQARIRICYTRTGLT